jgi:phospholipid/cholesterol/gamma-HCH transport system substrate-binding protein
MALRTRETMVGLFVTIGLLIGIGGLVWLGASEVLQGGTRYVSYFDQSVAGISSGSPVKYMGLDVGSVSSISVSPDPTLMAVAMRIRRPDLVTERTVAEIQSQGFTGASFIELSQKDKKVEGRKLPFQPPLPVIPAQRAGGMGALVSDASQIADKIESLDLQGIVDDVRSTVRSVKSVATDPNIHRTIDNMTQASLKLHEITARIDRLVASDSFEQIPSRTEQILRQAQQAVADARKQIEALRLGQTSQQVSQMVGTVNDRSKVIAAQTEELLQELQQASDSLDHLLERLKENPSALIFGKPAPKRDQR